jgi:uracil-DNA glycosylase
VTADDLPACFASLPPAWRDGLPGWTSQAQDEVVARVRQVSEARPIAPADPFRALRFFAPRDTRVVILGQDPYPKPGHADGLAFSAAQGKPHSLRRIFAALQADRPGFEPPAADWRLDGWARQGVLLLNPTLTVEVGKVGSHMNCSWQALTSQIVKALCQIEKPPIFLLWGRPANGFFDESATAATPALRTRHPSHDFKREFMADGSHFLATQDRVDWWSIGRKCP